uniref:Uncharacterized protein n=1 Tax=Siphoviridae sp. ct4Z13 TaxID=2827778 RepID=A0A8S5SBN7_9CAUD|nr:MAG TPA: hypothetical protein [Siphoviridae sp. ct4Z13]
MSPPPFFYLYKQQLKLRRCSLQKKKSSRKELFCKGFNLYV